MVATASNSSPPMDGVMPGLILLQKNARRQMENRVSAVSAGMEFEAEEVVMALQKRKLDATRTVQHTSLLLLKRSTQAARRNSTSASDSNSTVANARSASSVESSARWKRGRPPKVAPAVGASRVEATAAENTSQATAVAQKTSPVPPEPQAQIHPTPEEVISKTANGTVPLSVHPGRLHKILLSLGHVAEAMAFADFSQTNSTNEERKEAENRLNFSSEMLARLQTSVKLTALELVDLTLAASRHQSAETMLMNGALLTASDFAQFVAFFRGEDFGTDFQHNTSAPNLVAVQGDIEGSRHEYLSAENTFDNAIGSIWPKGVVKYCFARDATPRIKQVFAAAVQHYQTLTPFLKFEEVKLVSSTYSTDDWKSHSCAAEHAIIVTSDSRLGCFSSLGMSPEKTQQLNLHDPGCALVGTAVHELGHALGMAHEHPRHVEDYSNDTSAQGYVFAQRIYNERTHHFRVDDSPLRLESYMLGSEVMEKLIDHFHGGDVSALYLQSDPLSIMHFDKYAFVGRDHQKYGRPLIRGNTTEQMGQRVGLSQSDVTHLTRLYAEETGTAQVSSLKESIGCIDRYSVASGRSACSPLDLAVPWCSATAQKYCCACGGGVHFHCTSGAPCSSHAASKRMMYWRALLLASVLLVCIFIVVDVQMRKKPTLLTCSAEASASSVQGKNPVQQVADGVEPSGPVGKAKAKAKAAFKALTHWLKAPVAGTFAQRERPTQQKLRPETIDRYQKSFAPCGGGFSSGRDAPAAPLVGGDDYVQQEGCALNHGLRAKCKEAAAAAQSSSSHAVYRMHCSDSSDHDAPESDPFERPGKHDSANEHSSDSDDAAVAS
eukprot:TRINITY_DN47926_c0_g1_i1.p1 TRINITY_DN47926_c0_g1~~TRINITY_DN47926_c0_g1_i1.p1  ORF type:complete len:867 (-),score=82.03 TRINITY_DN47926_c0_g1_i1:97-2598(-)